MSNPLDTLRHHVSGAIGRGEAMPIVAIPARPGMTTFDPARLPAIRRRYDARSQEAGGLPWCFVAVLDDEGVDVAALGVAEANSRGYSPIPSAWCHAASYEDMARHVEDLNRVIGVDDDRHWSIVASTMGGRRYVEERAA